LPRAWGGWAHWKCNVPISRARGVTLKEVGQLAGVSPSTVSRVLSGASTLVPITGETRLRVLQAAEALNYSPHPLARCLPPPPPPLLGLIVREIADPFFTALLNAIALEAQHRGYNLVLGHAGSSATRALALTQVLEVRHCEAILLVGDLVDESRLVEELRGTELAMVGLCQGRRSPGLSTVNTDNERGARLALDHLYQLGHRRIALLDAGWIGDVEQRRTTYFEFLSERGQVTPSAYHQTTSNDLSGGQAAFARLLGLQRPPTAVFATTDVLAIGAIKAAQEAGLHVPRDVSVVGFDDIPFAIYTVPSLTTVRQPILAMARLAIEIALRLAAEGGRRDEAPHLLEPELIVRQSTARPSERR
jgi:DNA-binding LacI/PurR family transcriptional regulator